jgi:(p)ppGpp synthase/HD superfamily hydrolase
MKKLLAKALALSADKHSGQFDKGGMPYFLHCSKVMYLIKSDDLELMCIAVMHDLMEDTDVTSHDLYTMGFTERVVEGVRALTKKPGQSYEEYLAIIKSNPDAIKVKLSDLRHNSDIRRLKGITDRDVVRMKKYHQMYLDLKDL